MADQTFEVELRIDLNSPNLQGELSRALGDVNNQVTGFDKKIGGVQKTLDGTGKSFQQLGSNARYALYDVSTTLAATGAGLLALAAAPLAVATAWERDFAQVVRTTGVVGSEVQALRNDLVDLAQTMPVAFGDLSAIATLAGQLGVAKDRVADFTRVTAQFSAVTDLTVEAAATAFGRLDALLPDVQGNYEALGSAIAKVGVESVATESQIVNISTQISSMGAYAGLTAAEVVGLSGALASIGAAPEISRGTVTRLFTQMSKAISDGGEKLQTFARVSGVAADEFAGSFGTNRFGPIFQGFIEGLADTTRSGGDAVAVLGELGITSVRDRPLLLRLAGAGDLLAKSFKDSREAIAAASELQRQYGVISETTAARIQILGNNFSAFLDAIGSANLGPLGNIVDALSGLLGGLTDLASTDVGGKLLGIATILGGLIGVLSLAGGAIALFGASTIGMRQGLAAIVSLAPGASAAILGTGRAAAIAGGEMTAAAVGVRALTTAFRLLAAATIILALPEITSWANDSVDAIKGFSNEIDEVQKRLTTPGMFGFDKSVFDEVREAPQWMNDLNRASADLVGIAPAATLELKKFDDELAAIAHNGAPDLVKDRLRALGLTSEDVTRMLPQTAGALKELESAGQAGANGIETLQDPLNAVEAAAQEAEESLKALRDALMNVGNTSISVEQSQIALSRAYNAMTEAGQAEGVTLDGVNEASLKYRDTLIDMELRAREAAIAISDNGGSAEEATAKYNEGREALIQSIQARGLDRAAAEEWANKIVGTAEEARSYVSAYTEEVQRVPQTAVTTFINNAGQGPLRDTLFYKQEVNTTPPSKNTVFTNNSKGQPWTDTLMYRDLVNSLNKTVTTTLITQEIIQRSSVDSGGRGRLTLATGGPVWGPGTATSDSVPAWLSNGEYVVNAAAVSKYGMGFMNALNSMRVPKFASGGAVSGSNNSGSAVITGGVVELGPQTMNRLGKEVVNNIMIGDVELSRAVERGNSKRKTMGEL